MSAVEASVFRHPSSTVDQVVLNADGSFGGELASELGSKVDYPSGGADGDLLTKSGTTTAWAAPSSGLELIATVAIGTAVSTVSVNNCFSATYTNYKILMSEMTGSGNVDITMQLSGLTSSNYNWRQVNATTTTVAAAGEDAATSWVVCRVDAGTQNASSIDVYAPAVIGNRIGFAAISNGQNLARMIAGQYTTAGNATGFTIAPTSGTISGGAIRVYGYRD
jgi:hypothetical protein